MAKESDLGKWYTSAVARCAHLPPGEERDRKVKATLLEIQREAEAVALRLPALSDEERSALLTECVLEVQDKQGLPLTEDGWEQELFDARVDTLFERLQLAAREQKASPELRAKLITRRMQRRLAVGA